MGRVKQESDCKSQLVKEICSISMRPIACVRRHCSRPIKSTFTDWYLILGVEEEAGLDVIRKGYHKLGRFHNGIMFCNKLFLRTALCAALQLHPDKNKHPKTEIAFKLVSEAYTCLSDNVKRRAFNMERWKNFCSECNRIPYTTCSPRNSNACKPKAWNPTNCSKSDRILLGLKDIRNRFKEEAKVIENCMRTNEASRKESPHFNPSGYPFQSYPQQRTRKESPVFNPSDYPFEGYPHLRTRMYKKPENFWCLKAGNILNREQGRAECDTPIFENRSERGVFKSRSACVRS